MKTNKYAKQSNISKHMHVISHYNFELNCGLDLSIQLKTNIIQRHSNISKHIRVAPLKVDHKLSLK